jgi:hypothetical protein
VQALDEILKNEFDALNEITSENKDLRQEILTLKEQFQRAAVENEVCHNNPCNT